MNIPKHVKIKGKDGVILLIAALLLNPPSQASTTTINVPENGSLSLSGSNNPSSGNVVIVAGAGSTLTLPRYTGSVTNPAAVVYPHLIVSGGVVRVECAAGSTYPYARYRFVSGLRSIDGGSLLVDGVSQITVDRQTVPSGSEIISSSGPLCDIGEVTFEGGDGELLLRYKSLVRKLPSTCSVNVEAGATVSLAGDNCAAPLLDGGTLRLSDFDVVAMTAKCLPSGCRIAVAPGRTFTFQPADVAENGFAWTGAAVATGNYAIELGGRGAKVLFANANGKNCRSDAVVTGEGEILFRPRDTAAVTRFHGYSYLASNAGPVSIPVVASAEPEEPSYVRLSGKGQVSLFDDGKANVSNELKAVVEGLGSYSGRIVIPNGTTLNLGRPVPPGEASIPMTGLVGWFDPSFNGAVAVDGELLGHADLLYALYGRDAAGILADSQDTMFTGGWRSAGGPKTNFAPRVETSVRGAVTTGPARSWLVFREAYSDGLGNMIRARRVSTGVNGGNTPIAVRQAFFAVDSSNGGGDIVCDKPEFDRDGAVKPRAGGDPSDPIWSPSNTLAVAHTWLDTAEIDGYAHGYSGRPEVLSFTVERDFDIGYIANYRGKGTEVVGEFVLYDTPLPDDKRTAVQEYLMYKWFGDLSGDKYADYTGATVYGLGDVRSRTFRNLPKFDPSFQGRLVGGGSLAFTIDAAVSAARAADAIDTGAPVVLDDDAEIRISVNGELPVGRYTLMTASALSGGANASVLVANNRRSRSVRLHIGDAEMWLDVSLGATYMYLR